MSDFSITRIRYLFEAVRLRGIRAAADFLDVAPSAVSRQIALLEKTARTPLLETNRRGANPTEAGLILLAYYREHVSREEALISQLDGIHGLQHGNVAVGAIQGFTEDLMNRALREFRQQHPNVTLTLRLGSVNDILTWLQDDQVHLGLTHGPRLNLHAVRLKEAASSAQPVCAIVKTGHPLTQLPVVRARDLFDHPFGLASAAFGTRMIADEVEALEKRQFKVALECDHLIGLMSFVRAGMGVTLLPAFFVHDDVQRGVVQALPIRHKLMEAAQAQLIVRRGRELPVGALKLQRMLTANLLAFSAPAVAQEI
ncbi:MAG: hypothetical protein QOC89_2607 [Paraburkholderia sp.]|jgi:DNA-binding transcriptional LysR family regulator|uniref:LysR family transcriptional regulator n=1 Tax=Paraburkholderia sp. TaxID=1926495 RepID=UPI002AFF241B|nr:LysR family transcriptional regulator [Paraburkholderia sp.]MEA3084910.1 hypothetical protein [Paraburkholderia sp.]MEA3130893.1 hypothetical protein [Paraburkholderia sp.]